MPGENSRMYNAVMDHTIILASQSIGRRKLLEKLGIPFTVKPAHVDEEAITHPDPRETIRLRARAKADHTLKSTLKSPISPKTLIIAADSMAILDSIPYGKPKDSRDAKRILQCLMGKAHHLTTHTVCLLIEGGRETKRWEETTETAVTLRTLSPASLDSYVHTYDLTRFAACYGLDETPWDLITAVDGSYTNVIGLPFETILPVFRSLRLT